MFEIQVLFCHVGIGEKANATRELARESKQKTENAVNSVQPILDTLDSDLESVNQVPRLQDQMNVELIRIQTKSTFATKYIRNTVCILKPIAKFHIYNNSNCAMAVHVTSVACIFSPRGM